MDSRTGRKFRRGSRKFLEGLAVELIEFAREAYFAKNIDDVRALFPERLAHLWAWYCELAAARTSSGFGVNPITYPDIEAWARIMRIIPTPFEARVLRQVDNAILEKIAARASKKSNEISVDDKDGLTSLFAGLRKRVNAKAGDGTNG